MSGSRRKPGRLGPYVEGYRARLLELGYSPLSVTHSLITLGHLGRWMDRHEIDVEQLDGATVKTFLADHVDQHGRLPQAGVMPLLDYLRSERVVGPEPIGSLSALDRLVAEYRDWLTVERELAPDTVAGYSRLARRFLMQRVSSEDELGADLTGVDVIGFLLGESVLAKPGSVRCYANQLRQLLRYLSLRGLADSGLAFAVPSVGEWRDAGLPHGPARLAVGRLLESCDRSRRVGVRDYAILMLLSRLGLRSIEVSRLEVGDLDWRAGEIEVDGKSRERARLPLPCDVGEALVDYLTVRGRRATRRVFLTEHAPTRPLQATGVRSVVRDACRRAGVDPVAAHRLRHALASQLLREGGSLIDVSQVLRHKHLESTAIYAKVDLDRLRQAAAPWPGAAR